MPIGSVRPACARQAPCASRATLSRSRFPAALRSSGVIDDGGAAGFAAATEGGRFKIVGISNLTSGSHFFRPAGGSVGRHGTQRARGSRCRWETRAAPCVRSSTRCPAAIAIATTWTISTARSPTTWQPRIAPVVRSAINLQKPVVWPSMIVRAVSSKRTISHHYVACVTRLRFGQAHLGIFRVGEAAGRTNLLPERHRCAAAQRWSPP